jgi:putative glutamine amidotransferase
MTRIRAPLIGITSDLSDTEHGRNQTQREPTFFLPWRYSRAVEAAGGLPVILAPMSSRTGLWQFVERLDGILISGGDFDIHPSFYGEKAIPGLGKIKAERTEFELELTSLALKRNVPLLGICGGAQAINVALGGSLYQDIASQLPNAGKHQQGKKKETGGHRIQIEPRTRLRRIVRERILEVNTTHHQAVKQLGKGLVINATADDGLIEGIESPNHSFVLGVQWHPEVLAFRYPHQRRIFSFFVSICRRKHRVRR